MNYNHNAAEFEINRAYKCIAEQASIIDNKDEEIAALKTYASKGDAEIEKLSPLVGLVSNQKQRIQQLEEALLRITGGATYIVKPFHTMEYENYTFKYDTAEELGRMVKESGCKMPNPFEPDFTEYDDFNEGYWNAKYEETK